MRSKENEYPREEKKSTENHNHPTESGGVDLIRHSQPPFSLLAPLREPTCDFGRRQSILELACIDFEFAASLEIDPSQMVHSALDNRFEILSTPSGLDAD